MTTRILVVVLGCAICTATAMLLTQNQPMVERIAHAMAGESWFRIQLKADHVGYMYNRTYRDDRGYWHFQTTTHFRLQDNAPTTISKHLVFAPQPPYALERAHYQNRQGQQHLQTDIKQQDGLYLAAFNGQHKQPILLEWQYDLPTFVQFERWLAEQTRQPGDAFPTKSIDFERLNIATRSYRVVAYNDQGTLVETNAPQQATKTQLDKNFRPVRLDMAGIFDVVATDEADAIALTNLSRKTNYLFSLDQRLLDHTQIKYLELALHGLDSTQRSELPQHLKLQANPVTSAGDGHEYTGEGLRYPITDARIQAIVQQALSNADGDQPAHHDQLLTALLTSTNQQLRYVEDRPAGSVLEALNRGFGECTDFADLFTTLARTAGLPARNVYGLAYKDGSNPAFMFHAWNEVYVDGRWQSVDPTWNQLTVDATHIPLTETQAALMMLANNTSDLRFEVIDSEYF